MTPPLRDAFWVGVDPNRRAQKPPSCVSSAVAFRQHDSVMRSNTWLCSPESKIRR